MRNSCLTYFLIRYSENFDFKSFCLALSLDYEYLKDFKTSTTYEIGRNEDYNVDINEMIRETLKDLLGKEELLLELKEKYNLEYYLERVPFIVCDTDEVKPLLSLDNDILEFLYKTKTQDDLDYYLYLENHE